jgi:mannose-6-phosphate isomerase
MTLPFKLQPRIVAKPWGRHGIDPRFGADPGLQVGEVWFEAPAERELDVMAKYLFTSERLSIQVHPDDDAARAHGQTRGKDECWIILGADDDAGLGIGTVCEASADEVVAAARDGSIVELMDWRKPAVGDFIYNPAGTIHALGPGLTVLEIQQAVDLTYRLFDYGRPRELHLEESRDVVRARPHSHRLDTRVGEDSALLVGGPYFGVAWCVHEPPVLPQGICDVQLLPIDAPVAGIEPGQCALVDEHAARRLRSDGTFVLAWSLGR